MQARALGALLVAAALTAGACSKKDKATVDVGPQGNTVEQGRALKTVSPGKLTVCSDIPHPPFEFEEGPELRGIDVDLAKAVTGRLGIAADFKDVDGPGLFDALKTGQCDVIASAVVINDEKAKEFDFTAPYFDLRQSVLVRKADEEKYRDIAALQGHAVGVVTGSPGADTAKQQLGGSPVKEFATSAALLTALTSGQVDAAVQDEPVNAYSAATSGQTAAVHTFRDGARMQLGFVVKKGNKAVLDAVNSALSQVRSDDSYRMIVANYLGAGAGQ